MLFVYDYIDDVNGRYIIGKNYEERLWGDPIADLINFGAISKEDTIQILDAVSGELPYVCALHWRNYWGFEHWKLNDTYIKRIADGALEWLKNSPVLNDIKSGKCLLVFFDYWESDAGGKFLSNELDYNIHSKFNIIADYLEVPRKHILYVSGQQMIENFQTRNSIRFIGEPFFEMYTKFLINGNDAQQTDIKHTAIKPLRFLSYARHWNNARQHLTYMMEKENLLQYGLVSLSEEHNFVNNRNEQAEVAQLIGFLESYKHDYSEFEIDKNAVERLIKKLPLEIDTHLNDNLANNFMIDHYLNTDLSIINETHFNSNTIFLSEKTWKTIYGKHPFIMASSPGTLAFLRKRGYLTFTPFINETYDMIENGPQRMVMVINSLKEFIALNDDERIKRVWAMNEIAEYNFNMYLKNAEGYKFDTCINAIKNAINENYIERQKL